MQKTLVACALALAFPVAFAQGAPSGSTVELYGILDIGVERVDVGTVSATRLQSGISAGSRLGVRGRESLGGGYTALFTLEMRVEADTGQNSNFGPLFICPPAPALCPGVTLMPPAARTLTKLRTRGSGHPPCRRPAADRSPRRPAHGPRGI